MERLQGHQSTSSVAAALAQFGAAATLGIQARTGPAQPLSPPAPPPECNPFNQRACSPTTMKQGDFCHPVLSAVLSAVHPNSRGDLDSSSNAKSNFFQLLRDENIRLREQNVELREQAIRNHSPQPTPTSMKTVPISITTQSPDEGPLSRTVPSAATNGRRGLSPELGSTQCPGNLVQRVGLRAMSQGDRPTRGLAAVASNQIQAPNTSRPTDAGISQSTPQARIVGSTAASLRSQSRNITDSLRDNGRLSR